MPRIDALDHVALLVADLEASVAWYCFFFGWEDLFPGQWGGVPVILGQDGVAMVALFPLRQPDASPPARVGRRVDHCAFRVGRAGFVAAREELVRRGIAFDEQDHAVARSLYFSDPDGYALEITTYELVDAG